MKVKKPLLSRKAKTVIYMFIVLVALTAIIKSNFPITPNGAFRLAEKANLISRSEILGSESVISVGQDAVIIAETEEFCITYAYQRFSFNNPDYLVCKKKTGDLTFLSIESSISYYMEENEYLPIILFDDYPQAVRATLVVSPSMVMDKKPYQRTYTAAANRNADGYFLFPIDWMQQVTSDSYTDDYILVDYMRRALNSPPYAKICRVPATVCLYDKDGQLILERELDLEAP